MIPLFRFSKYWLIPQIICSLLIIKQAIKLFFSWNDKIIKYNILIKKNQNSFRPESFKVFMQAPCGRLLTKAVLKDLGIKEKYKELCIYKTPFCLKNNCTTQKTIIRDRKSVV